MPPNKIFVRSPFNYDMDEVSLLTGLECKDPSLAVQSASNETDINVIVSRFGLTGQLPVGLSVPSFQDFEDIDLRMVMDNIKEAGDAFAELPADVRKRFGNDPEEFVMFCSKAENADELVKLGLAVKQPDEVVPPPMRVEVVNPVLKPA